MPQHCEEIATPPIPATLGAVDDVFAGRALAHDSDLPEAPMLRAAPGALLKPPATYQGGKVRLAPRILDVIAPQPGESFADLCCGSGAVAIEAVGRKVDPRTILMVDDGPWGDVWRKIGDGSLDFVALTRIAAAMPRDKERQADFLRELFKQSSRIEPAETFLILQAGSFGGAAVREQDGRWIGGPRGFWRSKENPKKWTGTMMPAAEEVIRRCRLLCEHMHGLRGVRGDFQSFAGLEGVVYVDPPYEGTSDYGKRPKIAWGTFYDRNPGARIFVSEAKPMEGPSATPRLLSDGSDRRMGGVSGKRAAPNAEWLTEIPLAQNSPGCALKGLPL